MFNRDFEFESDMNTQVAVEHDSYSSVVTFKFNKEACDYDITDNTKAFVKW
jgi:hypothetical protein